MKKVNVQWLLSGNPNTLEQLRNSNLASIRMRAALSMDIDDANLKVKPTNNLIINKDTNVLGVGKISLANEQDQSNKWPELVKKYKNYGLKVFLDYTDNHLRESNKNRDLYNAYHEIINKVDYVVTSSNYLESVISKQFNVKTITIEDPLEVQLKEPKSNLQKIPTGLWFGHASNLNYLLRFLQVEFKPSTKLKILVMSNLYPFPEDLIKNLENTISPKIELLILPWSISNVVLAASMSDFCIIPCGIGDDRKEGVSSNRLITSLALGLPCFADTPPSYKEFVNFISPLSTESIESFFINPSINIEKTLLSQTIIIKRFSKEKIRDDWKNFLVNII
jgi:hypothetical protein